MGIDFMPEPLRQENILVPEGPLFRIFRVAQQIVFIDEEKMQAPFPASFAFHFPTVFGIADSPQTVDHQPVFPAAVCVHLKHPHEIPVEVHLDFS